MSAPAQRIVGVVKSIPQLAQVSASPSHGIGTTVGSP
jgi:hypothetical protein